MWTEDGPGVYVGPPKFLLGLQYSKIILIEKLLVFLYLVNFLIYRTSADENLKDCIGPMAE